MSNFFSSSAFITGVLFGPLKLLLGIVTFFNIPSFFKDPMGLHKVAPIQNEQDARMGYMLLLEFLAKKQPVLGSGLIPGTQDVFNDYCSFKKD